MRLIIALALGVWAAGPAAAAKPAQFHMSVLVAIVEGTALIQSPGTQDWRYAVAGQAVPEGSLVRTKGDGRLTLMFTDGTKLRLGPNASFKLEEVKPNKIGVYIGLGRLESWVKKLTARKFTARNPVAVASVRGTDFVMDVLSMTEVIMDLHSGFMDVTDSLGVLTAMVEGQRIEAAVTGAGPLMAMPPGFAMALPPAPPPGIEKVVMAAASGIIMLPPGVPPLPGTPPQGMAPPPGTLPPPGTPPPPGMLPPPLPPGEVPLPPDGGFFEPLPLLPPPNVNQETTIVSPSAPPP